MEKEIIITCTCGSVIDTADIYHENRCNEEGEDYAVVSAECSKCGKEYETSKWGEWETEKEAIEYLKEFIKP